MSGIEFRRLLSELGYKSQQANSHLDWIFTANDQTKIFLTWLIHNLSTANVVTSEELQE
jgi:hypothetical protein